MLKNRRVQKFFFQRYNNVYIIIIIDNNILRYLKFETNVKRSDCGSSAHPQLINFYLFLKNWNLHLYLKFKYVTVCEEFHFSIILILINPLRI